MSTSRGEQDDNTALYADLLRRANGDRQLVALWLAEMGYDSADFAAQQLQVQPPQQQPPQPSNTIKAVGTREHGLGSWASAGASGSGKCKLGGTDDSELELKDMSSKDGGKEEDVDDLAAEAGAPRHFYCPIGLQLMRDPVMLPTGQSYERECIERWLQQGNSTCPTTGQELKAPVALTPNVSLRNAIEEWAEQHAPRLLDPATKSLKPIPRDSSFAPPPSEGQVVQEAADRALAVQLQEAELARITSQRAQSARREEPGWRTLTTLFIALVSAAFVAIYVLSIWQNGWSIENPNLNPLIGGSQSSLMKLGAQSQPAIVDSAQWWRLVTSMWVSAGVIQLLGNVTSLWSFAKHLERVLPLPWLSNLGVFLVSGVLGAVTSANLNAYYVSCGASGGICGLLGGVWADQLFNWKQYSRRLVGVLTLVLTTAVFVAVSLLPLLDPWFVAGSLVAGFCCTTILLLVNTPVGSGSSSRRGSRRRRRRGAGDGCAVVIQTICATVLVAGAAVGIAGLAVKSSVGQDCGFCYDVSCLRIDWWTCVQVYSSSSGCGVTVLANGTQALECPSGDFLSLQQLGLTSISPNTDVSALCGQYCTGGSSAPSTPGSSPAQGGSSGGGTSNPLAR